MENIDLTPDFPVLSAEQEIVIPPIVLDGGPQTVGGFSLSPTSISNGTIISASIGGATIQYKMSDNGIFSFGDGSDGAGVADGVGALAGATLAGSTYTLTRDVYYTDLTVSTGITINPAGYRIFGTGTLTLNGTATIARNGNNGGNGGNGTTAGAGGTAGTGGTALADGYLKGSVAGVAGGVGSNAGGVNGGSSTGTNTTNSIGSNGVAGGNGGQGGQGTTGQGTLGGTSTAGTATASNIKLIANWHLATLLDISSTGASVKFDNSAGAAGGGGGGLGGSGVSGSPGTGGGGGGAASNGGIIAVYFRNIIIGVSASITANGGIGGKGGIGGAGTGNNGSGGGGGGGGGGNGGQILMVYNTLTNNGTISVNGGAKGTKGTGGVGGNNPGVDGVDGTSGVAGTIRQFQISM